MGFVFLAISFLKNDRPLSPHLRFTNVILSTIQVVSEKSFTLFFNRTRNAQPLTRTGTEAILRGGSRFVLSDNANNAFSNKIGTIHREEDFGADGFFRGIQHRI